METNGIATKEAMPQAMADYYNKSATKDAPNYFPYIKVVGDEEGKYEWVMKLPGEKDLYHLGDTIKGKILATYICYNYYDVDQKKATIETNKFNYGETVVIYDYNENKVIDCGTTKDGFKAMQQKYREANQKLKYNKVLYVQLESGHVVEMYVKLSQTHKVKKVDGKFGYDLENPLTDGLEPIMKGLQARYPFADLEIGIGKYSIPPVTYTYPTFKQLGESTPDYTIVQGIFKSINDISMAKLISLTTEKGEATSTTSSVQDAEVIEATPAVGFNSDDDLPF